MSTGWVEGLFAAIDAKDTGTFLGYLSRTAEFRFGNAEPVVGRDAIGAAVDGFFATIESSVHYVRTTWEQAGSLACHGEVTYTRVDGSQVTVPFANVFYLDDENKIREYLIHIDQAPLFADDGG